MLNEKLNLLAYDVGNSAVRTILCRYENGTVSSEEVLVEPNGSFEENGYLYWDMDAVFESMKRGLALAAKKCSKIDSVGICTWGVDFRLLDENGRFIAKALCYRNSIGEEEISKLSRAERESMFYRTGILSDRINSVYMLKGIVRHMPQVFAKARKLLMVPDVFVYMFTGVLMNEPSELSTTQMLDVKTMQISREMCDYVGVTPELFSQIGEHGKAVGTILPEILAEAGIDYDIPLVCVPSHDTASAVTGIPSPETDYLFVSSGTWALIGADTDRPVITDETMRANLTNEVGAFGRTTLLRNSAGMFILQRLKAEYQEETGSKISWNDFTELAADWTEEPKIYDVNDSRFFNPEKMAEEIWGVLHGECAGAGAGAAGERPGAAGPDGAGEKSCAAGPDGAGEKQAAAGIYNWPEILASTYASLGESYAETLRLVRACTGKSYNEVYVVGGGSRNARINQRCADSLGLPVVACDMECSSVGNAAVQIAYFHPEYTISDLRKIMARSLKTRTYVPAGE